MSDLADPVFERLFDIHVRPSTRQFLRFDQTWDSVASLFAPYIATIPDDPDYIIHDARLDEGFPALTGQDFHRLVAFRQATQSVLNQPDASQWMAALRKVFPLEL